MSMVPSPIPLKLGSQSDRGAPWLPSSLLFQIFSLGESESTGISKVYVIQLVMSIGYRQLLMTTCSFPY